VTNGLGSIYREFASVSLKRRLGRAATGIFLSVKGRNESSRKLLGMCAVSLSTLLRDNGRRVEKAAPVIHHVVLGIMSVGREAKTIRFGVHQEI
jgi:hypothetical protein